jgi:hypothetical protein
MKYLLSNPLTDDITTIPTIAFLCPTRNEESLNRVMHTIRDAWPYVDGHPLVRSGLSTLSDVVTSESTDPPICSLVGYSCVASARARLAASAIISMPPVDLVVMLDDDIWLSSMEMLSIAQYAWSFTRPTVVFATYPIRQPKGFEHRDPRLAHYLHDNHVYGGLGCVAMRREVFEWIHTEPLPGEPLVQCGGGASTTAPYRVGPDREGRWLSEDLYFCARLHAMNCTTMLHSVPVRHGSIAATSEYLMLDGSKPPEFLLLSP